ncbi:hypothetical protein MMIC_P1696 [Mariprofundus micogutta]|uniref:Pilus assembly protein, PilO n=1 Tax=Mariprofundus micogutta TaxID=1921010 RepID=A0A1L8CPA9_9PROT|nr:hypothetical protein [Mariprofundus micogutta]GAV20723.1 hypothetical protein MMIC_P1696 [Mariprofundus micogutta]
MSGKQGFISRMEGPLEFITTQLKQGWAARIVLIALILLSIGVIWWSINERLELLNGAKSISQQQETMRREIDHLQLKWSAQNHEKIAEDLAAAENKLMPDQNSLAEWLEKFIAKAQKQRINLIYNVGRAHPTPQKLGNVHLVPIQIILRPSRDLNQRNAYKKILDFAKSITNSSWRMDVTSASVTGSSDQLDQLEMYVEMWMRSTPLQIDNIAAINKGPA